ncbi:MAG TPA: SDR family NAD(P)-dependent oxidoreductase [Burkholderiales bacterium]|nr:SDR family NAD(P)-dependent oxidoreductase [Burkholderiales bacterium]
MTRKVALITGANQGLGFALVEGLCRALGPEATVYLSARNVQRGEEAVKELRGRGLSPAFLRLDVTDEASVADAAQTLRTRHGGVDIVIHNAAARMSRELAPSDQVRQFIGTNNHGTYRMIRAFGPLLKDHARFLVIASSFGSLRNLPPALHPQFDIATRSLEDIEQAMDDYVALVEADRAKEQGWPDWINVASKIGQVASARIMARDLRDEAAQRGILINAACPALIDTEASRPWFTDMSSAQTPAQAAVDVVWLATLPGGTRTPYGELVRHRKLVPWLEQATP